MAVKKDLMFDGVALRPTWKGNLFWLLVALLVVIAVAS